MLTTPGVVECDDGHLYIDHAPSKHCIAKTKELQLKINNIIEQKKTSGFREDTKSQEISTLVRRVQEGRLVQWEDNRNPDKTWSPEKRSKFVGDFIQGNALTPCIIQWKEHGVEHVRDPDCAMDGNNRLHAIMQIYLSKEPFFVGKERNRLWMPPPPGEPRNPKWHYVDDWTKRHFDEMVVQLITWEHCPKSKAAEMARNLNRATPMSAGQELKYLLHGNSDMSELLLEVYTSVLTFINDDRVSKSGREEGVGFLCTLVFKFTNDSAKVLETWNATNNVKCIENYFEKNTIVSDEKKKLVIDVSRLVNTLAEATLHAEGVQDRIAAYYQSLAACIIHWNREGRNEFPSSDMWMKMWECEYSEECVDVGSRGNISNFVHTLFHLDKNEAPGKRLKKRSRKRKSPSDAQTVGVEGV